MIKFKTIYRTGTHIEVLNYKLYQSLKPSNEQRLDNGQTRPEQLSSKSETSAEQSANNGQTTVAHKEQVKNYKERIKKQRLLDNKNRNHNRSA